MRVAAFSTSICHLTAAPAPRTNGSVNAIETWRPAQVIEAPSERRRFIRSPMASAAIAPAPSASATPLAALPVAVVSPAAAVVAEAAMAAVWAATAVSGPVAPVAAGPRRARDPVSRSVLRAATRAEAE